MGRVEHIAAMPGLGLWYLAAGYYLTGGELFSLEKTALTTWVLVAAFLADKIVTGSFKALYGKELFDYGRVDERFHLIAARRNISLVFLSAGALAGDPGAAFSAIAVWTVATLAFPLSRFTWIALSRLWKAEAGS